MHNLTVKGIIQCHILGVINRYDFDDTFMVVVNNAWKIETWKNSLNDFFIFGQKNSREHGLFFLFRSHQSWSRWHFGRLYRGQIQGVKKDLVQEIVTEDGKTDNMEHFKDEILIETAMDQLAVSYFISTPAISFSEAKRSSFFNVLH